MIEEHVLLHLAVGTVRHSKAKWLVQFTELGHSQARLISRQSWRETHLGEGRRTRKCQSWGGLFSFI